MSTNNLTLDWSDATVICGTEKSADRLHMSITINMTFFHAEAFSVQRNGALQATTCGVHEDECGCDRSLEALADELGVRAFQTSTIDGRPGDWVVFITPHGD